jgi:hypothetical protein
MFVKPRRIPEAIWACLGAGLLIAFHFVPLPEFVDDHQLRMVLGGFAKKNSWREFAFAVDRRVMLETVCGPKQTSQESLTDPFCIAHLIDQKRRMVCSPSQVAIETEGGHKLESRDNPRSAKSIVSSSAAQKRLRAVRPFAPRSAFRWLHHNPWRPAA